MNSTLKYLAKKFDIDLSIKSGITVDNVNRTVMAETLGKLGFKEGAEIGVAQGRHAEFLCKNIPGLKLHAIDIWDTYEGYLEYTNRIRRYYQLARKLLEPYDVNFVKKFSMDAVKDFEDNSLDFVYIDAAHDFKNIAMDIYEWSKKVKPGGIVYGHDYNRWIPGKSKYIVDVKDVVRAYMRTRRIEPWFVLISKLKDDNFRWDTPCWMFVRQEGDLV